MSQTLTAAIESDLEASRFAQRGIPSFKWLIIASLLTICLGPTIIRYTPIRLSWDDADYLARAVEANRALWSGDVHGLGAAMVSVHTPMMTFLGFPWERLTSWSSVGNLFFTLASLIGLLAAVCLYMLLRIGVKPVYLVLASLCVGLSLGPFPAGAHADTIDSHSIATGFYADNLLAWLTFAAVLLIPFEARNPNRSIRSAVVRGILCASIFSLGVLTKVSFFYFIVLIIPVLLYMRVSSSGIRSALCWLITVVCSSAPTAIFFLRYGRTALGNAKAASFGGLAGYYRVPQWQFLIGTARDAPGMAIAFGLVVAASLYLLMKKRPGLFDAGFIACLIMVGFAVVVLASPSKQSRYLFPAIVALPFLMAILLTNNKDESMRPRGAVVVAGVVLFALVGAAVPTRQRAYRQNLTKVEAVLAEAAQSNAKTIVLATDSPKLNFSLLHLASEFSSSGVSIGTMAYQAMEGVPIADDLRTIRKADMVVFQDRAHTNPKFTNQRVPEYEVYVQRIDAGPVRIGDDIYCYWMHVRKEGQNSE